MKYVKMLGLLAVAAAALMAFAGSASASTTPLTPNIHATSEGYATLHNPIATISCKSTVTGNVTSAHANPGASGPITTLSFTECTGGTVHVTDVKTGHVGTPGTLSITPTLPTGNGTLFSTGANITTTVGGIECGYTTNNTHIGTFTAGKNQNPATEHATLDIVGAEIKRTHGSFFCGSSGNWTGNYQVNTPTNLEIH